MNRTTRCALVAFIFCLLTPDAAFTLYAGDLKSKDPASVAPPSDRGLGFPSRNADLDALPGFQNPPPGYGEVPFWWWTGDPLHVERLIWQLDELHKKGISGPEARIFRHAVESGDATFWRQPGFDDCRWERITYGFGPQFWLLGPMPDDVPTASLDAELAKLKPANPPEPVAVAGKRFDWRPYSLSWRWGLEGDPGHQGWHGLKENVTDHFLCLGKRADALNEFKYVSEASGSRYYLWTSATVDRQTTARIVSSARRPGEKPHASEVLAPAKAD